MTQEEYHDIKKYIPESDTVKMVFKSMYPEEDLSDWDTAIETLMGRVLSGDQEALFEALELTYLNAHNEGMLEEAVALDEI